jgi:hypothetical protein
MSEHTLSRLPTVFKNVKVPLLGLSGVCPGQRQGSAYALSTNQFSATRSGSTGTDVNLGSSLTAEKVA